MSEEDLISGMFVDDDPPPEEDDEIDELHDLKSDFKSTKSLADKILKNRQERALGDLARRAVEMDAGIVQKLKELTGKPEKWCLDAINQTADNFIKTKSGQQIAKLVEKSGIGTGTKIALKKVPMACLVVGCALCQERFERGEFGKGCAELVSSIAGMVPGYGTAISTLIDVALLVSDMEEAAVPMCLNSQLKAALFEEQHAKIEAEEIMDRSVVRRDTVHEVEEEARRNLTSQLREVDKNEAKRKEREAAFADTLKKEEKEKKYIKDHPSDRARLEELEVGNRFRAQDTFYNQRKAEENRVRDDKISRMPPPRSR